MTPRKFLAAAALALAVLTGDSAPAPAQFVLPGYSYGLPVAVPAAPVAVYNPYVGYSYNPAFVGTYSPYIGHAFPRLSLYRNYYAYPYYAGGYSYSSYYNPYAGQAVSIYSGW